ncbi:Hypothetical protein NTJ_13883 [Nesidiocoris tenuis]|uniref:Uncharacterized protein n=1 Tax=Nesidiocoris tenuis TaxID=355587 RepID=A0ABN7B9J4_9HEMI|nr:Hypothetical protein NTJ_13883 [Nesidiocoris tenuis]
MSLTATTGHTSPMLQACMGFAFSGISFFLLLFPLRPPTYEKDAEMANLGGRVASCISNAIANKWRYRHSDVKKGSWVEFAGNKWDDFTLRRAKELVRLFVKLLPASGFTIFVSARFETLYLPYLLKLKATEFILSDGMYSGMRLIILGAMLLSQFALLPLLKFAGIKGKFHIWFLIGNLFGVLAFFYLATAFSMIETDEYDPSEGYIRIFNAREDNVSLQPIDSYFSNLNFSVGPKKAIMVQYQITQVRLVKMRVIFPKTTMPIYFSVRERECTGYVIVDPPNVIRIRGYLPLREGPPGTNTFMNPRIYVFHASNLLKNVSVSITDSTTEKKVSSFDIFRGDTYVFQLLNGTYDVRASYVPQPFVITVRPGGVYGLFIYSSKSNHKIALDRPVPENSTPAIQCLGFLLFYGAGLTLGYVTLRAITYLNAPRGLYATSFGYLSLMEQSAKWFMVIGYKTWHLHVTPITIFSYAFMTMASFLFSIFIFLKYRDTYEW